MTINRNNIIHNTIRVAFQNLIPICKEDGNDLPDSCVKFQRAYSPKQLHDNSDIVAVCPGNGVEPCVSISQDIRKNLNFNQSIVRVIYGLKDQNKINRMNYYPDNNNSTEKQIAIWGIDASNFVDMTVDLSGKTNAYHDDDKQHNYPSYAEKTNTASLQDSSSNQRNFIAVVVLDPKRSKYQDQSVTEKFVFMKT